MTSIRRKRVNDTVRVILYGYLLVNLGKTVYNYCSRYETADFVKMVTWVRGINVIVPASQPSRAFNRNGVKLLHLAAVSESLSYAFTILEPVEDFL